MYLERHILDQVVMLVTDHHLPLVDMLIANTFYHNGHGQNLAPSLSFIEFKPKMSIFKTFYRVIIG